MTLVLEKNWSCGKMFLLLTRYHYWLDNITAPAQSRLTGLRGWYQDLREPICSTWAARILADPHALPFRQLRCQEPQNLQRLVCKMPTRNVNMLKNHLKSMCWIRKVLLDCSTACVRCQELSRWCSAQRHLGLNSFWPSLLGTTLPRPHKSHPVTSSLVTLALMMKTRRRCLQRLRSDQKFRLSKIIHSGGKRSPEDLLTRPNCWKDSGPRLVVYDV